MILGLKTRKQALWSAMVVLIIATAFISVDCAAVLANDSEQIQPQTDPPQPPIRSKCRYHPDHLQLRALIYDQQGRWKPKEEVNGAELLTAVNAASRIIDDEALWTERASEEAINYGWYLYRDLQSGFTFALALAPTKDDERNWMLRIQALTVRLMHFLLDTRRRHPNYFRFAWKDGTPFAALTTGLESIRGAMNLRGVLKSDEWGMMYQLSWVDEPGAVLVRDGVVFVDASLPGKLMATRPYFNHFYSEPLRRARPRKAQIPIGSPAQAGPRRGFRDSEGRIYIPVEELQRQGELDVRVNRSAQLVQLNPYFGPRDASRVAAVKE